MILDENKITVLLAGKGLTGFALSRAMGRPDGYIAWHLCNARKRRSIKLVTGTTIARALGVAPDEISVPTTSQARAKRPVRGQAKRQQRKAA